MTKATRITSEARNGLSTVRQLLSLVFRCAPQEFGEPVALARNPQKTKARTAAVRFVRSQLAHFFDWGNGLIVVKQGTLIGGQRAAFRASGAGSQDQSEDQQWHAKWDV